MTVTATLSRRNTTVNVPILGEGGDPGIARDFGKPNLRMQINGRLDPRSMDQWAGMQNLTLTGNFVGDSAYSDARQLANFIKSSTGGRDTTLDIPLSGYDSDMLVVPAAGQDVALSLTYPPGQTDWVEFDLALTRVSEIQGAGTMQANTPTAVGSGPIELQGPSNTIQLSTDIEFTREVGRPNSEAKRNIGSFPRYIEHRRSSFDRWQLGFQDVDSPDTTLQNMTSMFETRLSRSSITLNFNGIFGLGAFDVIPQGSQAMRHVDAVGESGVVQFPRINLRVVDNA